jgi:superfamily II DNA or RNA helicase
MFSKQQQFQFRTSAHADETASTTESLDLIVTLDVAAGCFLFEWLRPGSAAGVAHGRLTPTPNPAFGLFDLDWELEINGRNETDHCNQWPASTRAFLKRLRKTLPVAEEGLRFCVVPDRDIGPAQAGATHPLPALPGEVGWKWLARQIQVFAQTVEVIVNHVGRASPQPPGLGAARFLAHLWLGVPPRTVTPGLDPSEKAELTLRLTKDFLQPSIVLEWSNFSNETPVARGVVRCTGKTQLSWTLDAAGKHERSFSSQRDEAIRSCVAQWLERFPARRDTFRVFRRVPGLGSANPALVEEPRPEPSESPWALIEEEIHEMAKQLGEAFPVLDKIPGEFMEEVYFDYEKYDRRQQRKEQKRAEEEARRMETMARLAEARRKREREAAALRKAAEANKAEEQKARSQTKVPATAPAERRPVPPVGIRTELPPLELQETAFALEDLRPFALRERAALWWVSNQSDDLLCLPHCRIQHLDYQVRSALRVLGPMRGRALLSDEVGLGKTIEAGLVLKELLTRGMVKRFLVLTVPSLVDQWEEELNDKFGLSPVTTNQPTVRGNPEEFWQRNSGVVASLHTLKQPAQAAIAREVHWDLLIVDEAHYLRNRESQAWQAVNALPRQFLLLLTATPVQNSLEELYNLVTLLQPGQLPSPKEFRARFIDPKRPRQPREPEELRRLLGQVMIRNTRANAGIELPPRRAETVLFEPDETERAFWQVWEKQFRESLARLNASQASLWGRLLLQAAGSSPAAWRDCLDKFPDHAAARSWHEQAPLEGSWRRKCELLVPLTRGEGGVVIFTQFLQTQSALAEELRRAAVETFVINGVTPAPERQPITEAFHSRGGALLLTHSGTEGRNLQFSHRLANFDLPWNPMEIEQRIGRLHRLGQQHPVRIYNFVQAGTLQEHLLNILQEKLNLFELVVGETGLVLGERFSSDEFAEEVLRRWRDSEGGVAEAMAGLGDELAKARESYGEVKQLDDTLFAKDYESL